MIGQLSPEQQKGVAGMVNPVKPTLNQLFDKLLDWVAEILRPTIDSLKGRLAALTT